MAGRRAAGSRRYIINAYGTALLLLAGGLLLSLRLDDWSWFSRSGSLVVVNGIILTSHQIIAHIHQLERERRLGGQVNRDWAGEEKYRLLHEDAYSLWANERCGLYMLIAGTLIWGFGDLFNLL